MIRRLSTAASAILLLLGVGTAVLWVRSHFVFDSWSYGRSTGSFCELSSGFGRTCVEWGTTPLAMPGLRHSASTIEPGFAAPWGQTNAAGFRLDLNQTRMSYDLSEVDGQTPTAIAAGAPASVSRTSLLIAPYWFLFLLWSALFWITFRLRRRTPAPGCCATCGYDLRSSTDRCPECGTAITAKMKT